MQGIRHRHKPAIIFFLLILAVALPLCVMAAPLTPPAKKSVKIHGKITDANGDPVEFATVRIAGTALGTTSSLEGDY